jgi:hypothetical protein
MIALLLRLYPARWRDRYGDEFAAILEERPLGPFDVADVLLGALDANLHLRGLGAASQHGKGFAMSLRIGGYAAVVGGLLWLYVLAANAINDGAEAGAPMIGLAVVAATVATLVALIGLSAFQSRRHPALTWAAFAIPAVGAVVGLLGALAMAVVGDTDARIVGGLSLWAISTLGLSTLLIGSALFAVATWLTKSLSRAASALLGVGALLVIPAIGGAMGGVLPPALEYASLVIAIVAFPAGWTTLGVSALRVGRGPVASMGGASA